MKFLFSLCVVIVCSTLMSSGQSPPELTFEDGVIHVTGLGPATTESITEIAWREILSIYTEEAFRKGIDQPVAGTYTQNNIGISFEPTFPFSGGTIYHAVFFSEAFTKATGVKIESPRSNNPELVFEIPKANASPSFIESIYPESTIVPENLLRMYIYFSGPMMQGEAYNHIKLFNERGEPIEKAFLIVDQELWNKERTRLTILFDPGRIKRGLKANLDLGPPLKEGEKYYIVIDSTWQDANGNNLQSSYRKSMTVSSAERTKLSIKNLETIIPAAGSREPLVISFDRQMDHALVSNTYPSITAHLRRSVWKFNSKAIPH
jgi:hypothetical protein